MKSTTAVLFYEVSVKHTRNARMKICIQDPRSFLCLFTLCQAIGNQNNRLCQQDNDPKHTAKSTKKWLVENNSNILKWPSHSPSENLCRHLKIQIQLRAPTNILDLKTICEEDWIKIPTKICKWLIENCWKILVVVKGNNCYSTKY